MQDWKARDQCKGCRYGQYCNFVVDERYQPIKCGITQEIHLTFEKCNEFTEVLPIIDKLQKTRLISESGFYIDFATMKQYPCKKGRFPDHVKPVTDWADCY